MKFEYEPYIKSIERAIRDEDARTGRRVTVVKLDPKEWATLKSERQMPYHMEQYRIAMHPGYSYATYPQHSYDIPDIREIILVPEQRA